MSDGLTEALAAEVAQVIEARLGLLFPPARWPDLSRALSAAASKLGFAGATECARWLVSHPLEPAQVEVLAAHLTIGETYFFRESKAFEALETQVLPALIAERLRKGKRLRIWSAGCCSGEEAYSIAICMRRLLGPMKAQEVDIIATDVNPRFLRKACRGVYGKWSFRGMSEADRKRYFRETPTGQFEILPEIKAAVTCSALNLATDDFPSPVTNTHEMNVVFCRNVLMYFSPAQAAKVAARLHRSLAPEGWLFVSAAEASREWFGSLAPANLPGTIAYRKTTTLVDQRPSPAPRKAKALPPVAPANFAGAVREDADTTQRSSKAFPETEATKLSPVWHYERGLEQQESGAADEALASFKRALYLDPQLVVAHVALGALSQRQGHVRDARRCFRNARALLEPCAPEILLPASGGLTAGRMLDMLSSMQNARS